MSKFTLIEPVTVYYVRVVEAESYEDASEFSSEIELSGPITWDKMPEKLDLDQLDDGMNVIAGDYFDDPNLTTNC